MIKALKAIRDRYLGLKKIRDRPFTLRALSYDVSEYPRMVRMFTADEGKRLRPYVDTTGHITIGVGRNLQAKGITEEMCMLMLGEDIEEACAVCYRLFGEDFDDFAYGRRFALINMAFNLGEGGLRKFKKMLTAIEKRDWDRAAEEALDSLWAKQVGSRAKRVARMLQTGDNIYAGIPTADPIH